MYPHGNRMVPDPVGDPDLASPLAVLWLCIACTGPRVPDTGPRVRIRVHGSGYGSTGPRRAALRAALVSREACCAATVCSSYVQMVQACRVHGI